MQNELLSLDGEQEDLPACQTVACNLKFYNMKIVVCLQSFANVSSDTAVLCSDI